mmetsp:Transcript_17108/g.20606  ORF Transcript_17108/g.20606 Transcript_17108/m.20606 type:complete len:119 (+) Transcript_17108:1804-2160(+)
MAGGVVGFVSVRGSGRATISKATISSTLRELHVCFTILLVFVVSLLVRVWVQVRMVILSVRLSLMMTMLLMMMMMMMWMLMWMMRWQLPPTVCLRELCLGELLKCFELGLSEKEVCCD